MPTIALITCSARPGRVGPYVASYVQSIITPLLGSSTKIHPVDLSEYNLPMLNEPKLPMHLPADNPTPHYTYQHTKDWSTKIKEFDGYIFVSPQYNGSIPAVLKNALDYLYHEWSHKPAGIVTYGARGGPQASAHLRGILGPLHMDATETAAELKIKVETDVQEWNAAGTGKVSQEAMDRWKEDGGEENVKKLWEEINTALEGAAAGKA